MSENESCDESGDAYRKYLFEFDNWIASRKRDWSFEEVKWRIDEIVEISRADPEDSEELEKFRRKLVNKKGAFSFFYFKRKNVENWLVWNKYAEQLQHSAIRDLIHMDDHCWEFRIHDSHRPIATRQKQIKEIIRPQRPHNPDKDSCPRRLCIPR